MPDSCRTSALAEGVAQRTAWGVPVSGGGEAAVKERVAFGIQRTRHWCREGRCRERAWEAEERQSWMIQLQRLGHAQVRKALSERLKVPGPDRDCLFLVPPCAPQRTRLEGRCLPLGCRVSKMASVWSP